MWRCPEDPCGSRNPLVQSCILVVQNDIITLYFAISVRTNSNIENPFCCLILQGHKESKLDPLFQFYGSIPFLGRTILSLGIKSFKLEDPRTTGIERKTSAVGLFDLLYLFSFYILILSPCILWYKRLKSTKNTWWIWGYTIWYTDNP